LTAAWTILGGLLLSHWPAIAAVAAGAAGTLAAAPNVPPLVAGVLHVVATIFAATAGAGYAGPKIAQHVIEAASRHD